MITIGSFDGVHRGHQALIETVVREARKRHLRSLALAFKVPPRMILDPAKPRWILSDPAEKRRLLLSYGIDEVEILEFDRNLARLKPFHFFRDVLLGRFRAAGLVVGADFRFGVGRAAGAVELVRWGQEFEIPVWVVPPVRRQRTVVSSSLVRGLLREGRFRRAMGFLGHPYLVEGRVVAGRGVGRRLGFATANLRCAAGKILPGGVFAVRARVDGSGRMFEGVCNIGRRPTLVARSPVVVEVHLFGRAPVRRGKRLAVELLWRLRAEKKFASAEALRRAVANDVRRAQAFFAKTRGDSVLYSRRTKSV